MVTGRAAGLALAGLVLTACSVSTTDKPGYEAPNPLDPSGTASSGSSPEERVDLQLRQVLGIEPGDPTRCPSGKVATPPALEPATLCSQDRTLVYTLSPAAVDGNRPTSIEVTGSSLGPVVRVRLDVKGATSLSNLTLQAMQEAAPRSKLAIVSHGRVQAAPVMTDQVAGGILDISGFETAQAAQAALDFIQRPS
jgi:hypothetical protein